MKNSKQILFIICLVLVNSFNSYSQIDSLKMQAAKEVDTKKKMELFINITKLYSRTSIDSALVYANKTLQLAQTENNQLATANVYIEYISIYFNFYDYNKAITYGEKALKLYKALNDKPGIIKARYGISLSYKSLGDYYNAISVLNEAMELADEINDETSIYSLLHLFSAIYQDLGDHETSLEYKILTKKRIETRLKTLEDSDKKDRNLAQLQMINYNMTWDLVELNRLDEAEDYLNKLKVNPIVLKRKSLLAHIYSVLGDLHNRKDNLNKSQYYSNKAFNIYKDMPTANISYTYANSAEVHLKQNELDSAYYKGLKAFKEAEDLHDVVNSYDTSKLLHKICLKKNLTKEALHYASLALSYNDTINQQNKTDNFLKKLVAVEKNSIERQKRDELKIASLENKKLILYLLFGFATLIGLLLLFSNRRLKVQKNKVEFMLDEKIKLQEKISYLESSIASDLHDNFGNRISGLISSFDIVKQEFKNKISAIEGNHFKKHIHNLDQNLNALIWDVKDMLWANQTKNNTVKALINRLDLFVGLFNKEHPKIINFTSNYDNDYQLPAISSKQIFFAIKEMVHNFDKYAGVDFLEISLSLIENNIKIAVKDTGKGFDVKHLTRVNGLNNIKKRMTSIDLETEIISNEDEGVQIIISGHLENDQISLLKAV